VALLPVAFAFAPTAVEAAPVGTIAWQVPAKLVSVDQHCAEAGAGPSARPAASASPHSAPVESAVVANSAGPEFARADAPARAAVSISPNAAASACPPATGLECRAFRPMACPPRASEDFSGIYRTVNER
jgi:hypothetical protein